jgi:Cu+-exporting ATPase
VLPSQKANTIKELKKENKFIMMCGDGINDSPALASSDIGVSVNSGTDIAMDSSDVILTNSDLRSIVNLINISKKTIRNIKQNLFWAFFYNCLMIPIAIGILKPIGISINPMIASLAMVLSSITVILNTLRLKK